MTCAAWVLGTRAPVLAAVCLSLGCDCYGLREEPDETDASTCAAGAVEPGCPCPAEPVDCYDGPSDTLLVGACQGGIRACEDGRLTEACVGQVLPVEERCDGFDRDCDGVVEADVCRSACIGVECARGWAPPPAGFHLGPGGGLVLDMPADADVAVLWIAELFTGTLAKVDTRRREVVARYRYVAPDACETNEHKLAIATGPNGNVYVTTVRDAAPYSGRVLSVRNVGCTDRDGDGVVESSSGPDDILLFGEDECIQWTFETDHPTVVTFQRASWGGAGVDRVWLADGRTHRVWAVEPDTGEETGAELTLEEPDPDPGDPGDDRSPADIEMDSRGLLYASMNATCWGQCTKWVAVVDTAGPSLEAFVETPYERGPFDSMVPDARGRLWARRPASYDSATDSWTLVDTPHAIGAMVGLPTNQMWAVVAVPERPFVDQLLIFETVVDAWAVRPDVIFEGGALALDVDGQVWEWQRPGAIGDCGSDASTSAWVWNPWTMERELALDRALHGGFGINDNQTGVRPMDIRSDPRAAVFTFEGCAPEEDTTWRRLGWRSDVPGGTSIRFAVQASESPTPDALGEWTAEIADPPGGAPIDLHVTAPARYLHVRATLVADDPIAPPDERTSPELLRIEATYDCVD